jgi:hypothetical protein
LLHAVADWSRSSAEAQYTEERDPYLAFLKLACKPVDKVPGEQAYSQLKQASWQMVKRWRQALRGRRPPPDELSALLEYNGNDPDAPWKVCTASS